MTDEERIAKLRIAVTTSKAQFEYYADQHDRKGTPEADEKAKVNRDLAKQMGDVLEETKEPHL